VTEHTCARLARALSEIPGVPQDMIERAAGGCYDDFMSELTFPMVTLVRDLAALAATPATPRDSRPLLRSLIRRVKGGEFAPTAEESRAWMGSEEGLETLRELTEGRPF
jgi:hypothetical protein